MAKSVGLAIALSVAALASSQAWACARAPTPPRLSGESTEAYAARIGELNYKRELESARMRQAEGLRGADFIFIARDTAAPNRTSTTYRPTGARAAPPPAYYKPIDWFRGQRSTASFRVQRSMTMCGILSFGDTSPSRPGNLYLFFARKGPLSEKTMIDAIALDKIDDPALSTFVAKYRGKTSASNR